MKDILFFIPTLGSGGAEKVLVNIINHLDQSKYKITLYCLFDNGINKQFLTSNIKYEFLWKKQFRGNIHFFKLFSPYFLYKRIINDEYDIVISFLEGPTTRILSGCPHKDTILINWIHTDIKNTKDFLSTFRNKNEMINIYQKYDKTIFVSNTAKNTFQQKFPLITNQMEVKYNPINKNEIIKKSLDIVKDTYFDRGKLNMITVGRYIEVKGHIRLIKIINSLVKKGYDNIHLYLIGEGRLKNEYFRKIKEFNLEEHVTLLGYRDNPYKYVKNADLFICSSYQEGLSTAVAESLIVKTPVITTSCSGMEELLGKGNEYGIITDNSKKALEEGLENIINNPKIIKEYENKLKEKNSDFEFENAMKEIEKLLDNSY